MNKWVSKNSFNLNITKTKKDNKDQVLLKFYGIINSWRIMSLQF